MFKSVVIYLFFLAIIVNISIIIYFFLNLFIQACNYWFYMLVSWFLLVHTCDIMYILTNYT